MAVEDDIRRWLQADRRPIADIAAASNVDLQTVLRFRSGTASPSLRELERIARTLGFAVVLQPLPRRKPLRQPPPR